MCPKKKSRANKACPKVNQPNNKSVLGHSDVAKEYEKDRGKGNKELRKKEAASFIELIEKTNLRYNMGTITSWAK